MKAQGFGATAIAKALGIGRGERLSDPRSRPLIGAERGTDSRISGENELIALQAIWRPASAAACKRTGSRSPSLAAITMRLAMTSRTTSC